MCGCAMEQRVWAVERRSSEAFCDGKQLLGRVDALEKILLNERNFAAPKNQSCSPGVSDARSPQYNDALEKVTRHSELQKERIAALEKTLFGEHYRFSPKNQSSNPGAYSRTPPQNRKRRNSQVYSSSPLARDRSK